MASDDNETNPATAADVDNAHRAYELAKARYRDVLARYVTSHPDIADPLFERFSRETALLRVLHALSVGYGWSEAIYDVSTRAEVAQAQLRGCITRDELHGGLVMTQAGVALLQRWTEYVVPLTDKHPRYRALWRAVTGLEG
jgi:hypothetical protein